VCTHGKIPSVLREFSQLESDDPWWSRTPCLRSSSLIVPIFEVVESTQARRFTISEQKEILSFGGSSKVSCLGAELVFRKT
jgi:hypothetical protein